MDGRAWVAPAMLLLIAAGCGGAGVGPAKPNSVNVAVDGVLGTILRQEQSDQVAATVVAAGGEFVIDASTSKKAREDLLRLAEKYSAGGSSAIASPRLKVTGRLESRTTKVVDDEGRTTDGSTIWVLVADSVAVTEESNK